MEQYGWIGFVASLAALVWYLVYHKSSTDTKSETPTPQFQLVRPMPQRISQVTEPEEPKECHVEEPIAPAPTTRSLLFSVLRKLNLDYELDEGGDIHFKYQGENLEILADDEKKYIIIRDLWWYSAPLDDIDNLAILHLAVNECNLVDVLNVIAYSQDTRDNTINLHTFRALHWIPEIPDVEKYFLTSLDHILYMHHMFYEKMENIRREQYSNV